MTDAPAPDDTLAPARGILLQAAGDTYLRMAARLAQSLARHMPDLPVDLFTDAETTGPDYARVHVDPAYGPKGKIAALRASRFDHSLYMDVDMIAVAPFADVFDLLDAFDMALAQDQMRVSPDAMRLWRRPLPPTYPQLNGGFIAWRRNPATIAFLTLWEESVAEHGVGKDQPALRERLWDDRTLRVTVLPEEYNLWDLDRIDGMDYQHAAPRILHNFQFKAPPTLALDPDAAVEAVLGPRRAAHMRMIIGADPNLAPAGAPPRPVGRTFTRRQRLAVSMRAFGDLRRKGRRLRRLFQG